MIKITYQAPNGEWKEVYAIAYNADEIDDNRYVQVRYLGQNSTRAYTYIDPSGRLNVGDLVQVPTTFSKVNIGEVYAVDVSKPSGVAKIKTITARIHKEHL